MLPRAWPGLFAAALFALVCAAIAVGHLLRVSEARAQEAPVEFVAVPKSGPVDPKMAGAPIAPVVWLLVQEFEPANANTPAHVATHNSATWGGYVFEPGERPGTVDITPPGGLPITVEGELRQFVDAWARAHGTKVAQVIFQPK